MPLRASAVTADPRDQADDEEEENAIVNQILEELGVEMQSMTPNVPTTSTTPAAAASVDEADRQLEERLANLRRE